MDAGNLADYTIVFLFKAIEVKVKTWEFDFMISATQVLNNMWDKQLHAGRQR